MHSEEVLVRVARKMIMRTTADKNSQQRKRVFHIIHNDGPGGGPRSALAMVRDHFRFYTVTVIHGNYGLLAAGADQIGVRRIQIPMHVIRQLPKAFVHLWWVFLREKPDAVILHGQWAAPLATLAARCAGVYNLVYICRWPAFYTDWDICRILRNYVIEKIPCMFSKLVIALSESNRRRYVCLRFVPFSRIVAIPNPVFLDQVPDPEARNRIRALHDWKADRFHVVSVGRLSDQKRVDWLIRAWERVVESVPYACLWLIGDGPEEQKLRDMARSRGLMESCNFLGAQAKGWDYVAAADLIVMTSMYESRGNVLSEAMACGIPIVANSVDGIRDSMSNAHEGYLVSPANPVALAKRIIELAKCPDRRELMGNLGRSRVSRLESECIFQSYRISIETALWGNKQL